jgi:hypothetical protein
MGLGFQIRRTKGRINAETIIGLEHERLLKGRIPRDAESRIGMYPSAESCRLSASRARYGNICAVCAQTCYCAVVRNCRLMLILCCYWTKLRSTN